MEFKNKEIERKFLIRYPSEAVLASVPSENRSRIIQTYLISKEGITSRVRSRTYPNGTIYTKTEKKRINSVSCFEDERELTKEDYEAELKNADPNRIPIEKERLLLASGKHIFEIDIYPFWGDRAIMEVELSDEDEDFVIPEGIELIKDVTEDRRYKNSRLAENIPMEDI